MHIANLRIFLLSAAALSLGACGAGGASHLNSTPPPPQTPTPTPTPTPNPGAGAASVTIFSAPTPGTYATVGTSHAERNLYPNANSRFGTLSSADSNQPHIRYTSAGYYEIQFPNTNWDGLVHYKALANPTSLNTTFEPATTNGPYLSVERARDSGYLYSELAQWGANDSRSGWMAFGVPTAQGAVPITGSASYQGLVHGSADIMQFDGLAGGYFPVSVDGTVNLKFNFAQGSLAGAMALYLPDGMQPLAIGTYAFKDTIFSVGGTTYSGKFDTTASDQNFFLGQFTGPNAQETIGTWAIPFVFSTSGQTINADGETHQAFGAWIAKNH